MVAQAHHQKRQGHHQKHSKPFLKVYSPYLPIILIVGLTIFAWTSLNTTKTPPGVLSYATHISSSELLSSTNEQRLSSHELALQLNGLLARAAQDKANDMATRNYWSHNTPDGKSPWAFVDAAHYQYKKAGENLAYGFDNSDDVIAGWMNSLPHRENILDNSYREVGFGIANARNYQNSGPETIVVAIYGRPANAATSSSSSPAGVKSVNSDNQFAKEPTQKIIAQAQTLTGGKAPWVTSLIGIVVALSLVSLVVRHGLAIKKALKGSERFVLSHPLLDATVISIIILGIVIMRSSGFIR